MRQTAVLVRPRLPRVPFAAQEVRAIEKANPKFIVDTNAGKLARWLRVMGYDTVFFKGINDSVMVARALKEGKVILTRDTRIMERGLITSGRVKAILIASDEPEQQLQQVVETLKLDCEFKPFSICLECNQPLEERTREEVKDRVPPYVFKTQNQYMACPRCRRIYWRGTHWTAMANKLKRLMQCNTEK